MGTQGRPRLRDMAKHYGVVAFAAAQQRGDFLKPSRQRTPNCSLLAEAAARSGNGADSGRPFEAMHTVQDGRELDVLVTAEDRWYHSKRALEYQAVMQVSMASRDTVVGVASV